MGVELHSTSGTHKYLREQGIHTTCWNWPEETGPNVLDSITSRQDYDLVINIPKNTQQHQLTNAYHIRRKAVDYGIPLHFNLQTPQALLLRLTSIRDSNITAHALRGVPATKVNFELSKFKQVSNKFGNENSKVDS